MTRVLVADGSPTARAVLVEVLRTASGFEVVAEAEDGFAAVGLAKAHRPDVVVLDLWMPGLDGAEATRCLMSESPVPIVVMTAAQGPADVESSVNALRLGALAVIDKPAGPCAPGFEEHRRQFVATVKAMSEVKVVRRWATTPLTRRCATTTLSPRRRRRGVVAMVASTGGPGALHEILSRIGPAFDAPILVVQHMTPGFLGGFVRWLDQVSGIRVKLAEDGEPLEPGTAYVAPDGGHLGLRDARTAEVGSGPPRGGFRPSGTHLFESVARVAGRGSVGVALTGMGDDGVEGLRALRAAGGRVLVQDEASSVVFGIPRAAIGEGLAREVLPLARIAGRLTELFAQGAS